MSNPYADSVESLKRELSELRQKIDELRKRLDRIIEARKRGGKEV